MKISKKTTTALADLLAFDRGEEYGGRATRVTAPELDVKAIRERLTLSQEAFAERFGLTLASVKHWEQGRPVPEGTAKIFLRLIERQPQLVERELKRATIDPPPG